MPRRSGNRQSPPWNRKLRQTSWPSRLVAILLVPFAVGAMLGACGGPTCTGNEREYNGACMSGVAIT